MSEKAKALIAERGYDPIYGARPLKRYIQRELETKVGRAILAKSLNEGTLIRVEEKDGELIVSAGAGAQEKAA